MGGISIDYNPFLLVFHITGKCNLNCKYCYASPYDAINLEDEKIKHILFDALNLGTKHVILSGGEPFLHPGIYGLIKYANNIGLKIHITSNGTLIDDTNVEFLKSVDAMVTISLDGSCAEINDPIRGKGSYESAINAIDELVDANVPTSMRMTLIKDNLHDVENYIKLALDKDVDRCIIERVTAIDEIPQSRKLEPSYSDLYETFKLMFSYKNENELNIGSNDPLWLLFNEDIIKKHTKTDHICGGCTAGVASITINPDLKITPCPRLPVTAGDLNENSFEDIWFNSNVLQDLRNRDLFKGCSKCSYKYICGGCRGAAYAHDSYLGKDPQCWRINE
jgi:radical SAM protein with 4Fe4S-binding SPASM domain